VSDVASRQPVTDADGPLVRAARGEAGAVDELVDRFGSLVWALAVRGTPDRAEAEDAVQDIFINLWRFADRFDPGIASETTFVAMVARRRLIDRRRRMDRRPDQRAGGEERLPGLEAADVPGLGRGAASPERREELQHVFSAMEQLRPEQQRVLRLSIGGERTYEQVAQALGMPVGTVKTHARRGLIRLRELLAGSASSTQAEVGT
jgi:RNA polymerase sigma factor (sigma-70 family)